MTANLQSAVHVHVRGKGIANKPDHCNMPTYQGVVAMVDVLGKLHKCSLPSVIFSKLIPRIVFTLNIHWTIITQQLISELL